MSLGHKQLEENPWDVFETVFTVGSVHEGTIIEMLDKGAVVALPYGVEGFATPKHLVKEDGSQAQLDEKLEFKVIEFNKDAKRIILLTAVSSKMLQRQKKELKRRLLLRSQPVREKTLLLLSKTRLHLLLWVTLMLWLP